MPLISSWSYLHICTGEEINKAKVEDGKVEKDKEREDTNTQGRRHKRTGEKKRAKEKSRQRERREKWHVPIVCVSRRLSGVWDLFACVIHTCTGEKISKSEAIKGKGGRW